MKLATLTTKGRKRIAPSNFVFPPTKTNPKGRYPIQDLAHARNALARSSGKPEEAKVKAAVYRKYPQLKANATQASEIQRYRLPPFTLRLTETDDGVQVPQKIQLFRTGTFKKLMPDGKTVTFSITRETLSGMLENWKKKVRGVDIALDFAHRSDEEAAGWFTNLELTDNGNELWAEIDWTPDGHAAVAGKKFRYVSPDFAFAWTDNETGEKYGPTLFGAGLTNRPVIKNMAPTVELTEVESMDPKELEALKLKLAEQEKAISALTLKLEEMSDDSGDEDDSDDDSDSDSDNDEDDADGNAPAKKKKPKSADEMNLDELKAAYTKMCSDMAKMKQHAVKQLAEVAKDKKTAKFDAMLTKGQVCEAQREAFMADDTVKFAELAQPVNLTTRGDGKNPEKPADSSAQDEVLKLADEMVKAGKAQKKGDAISLVLSENKKLAERYEKEMNPAALNH